MKLVLHSIPSHFTVQSASLDVLTYDLQQDGPRHIQLSLGIVAENSSPRMDISFSDLMFNLAFDDKVILSLGAGPFDVPRKSAHPLDYTVRATSVVLLLDGRDMEDSLKRGVVTFNLASQARTHQKRARWWTSSPGRASPATSASSGPTTQLALPDEELI